MLEHSFDFTVKDNCNSEKIDNKQPVLYSLWGQFL